jgi:hypothetical protein
MTSPQKPGIDNRTKHEHVGETTSYETNPQQMSSVDKIGDKAVTHIAAGLFFALVLIGAAMLIHMMVREYWQEIVAALRGEMPVRSTARPWAGRGRSTPRARPVAVRVVQAQRAAS